MPRIVITLGDPAGIGPEVIEKSLNSGKLPAGYEFKILGDASAGTPGKPDRASAAASLAALKESARMLLAGEADAVVTGPVSKENLQSIGFAFPGQTEFFADAFGVQDYGMLLTGTTLTVGLATIHEPLADVSRLLDEEKIVRIGGLTAAFLEKRGKAFPKIAVAGLNPHAGEHGTFGNEEQTIISPAILKLNQSRPGCFFGPAVPDAIFRDAAMGTYDAVIAMYHDQGLIPLKLLDFDTAVNVTLGLPKPRTSPDHGTAWSIAGKGVANYTSMLAAIQLACELA